MRQFFWLVVVINLSHLTERRMWGRVAFQVKSDDNKEISCFGFLLVWIYKAADLATVYHSDFPKWVMGTETLRTQSLCDHYLGFSLSTWHLFSS